MFEIAIKRRIAAAHSLRGYVGQCAILHGHTWIVEAKVAGKHLDACGMLVDFKILKELIDGVISELDHTYLNKHEYFSGEDRSNPTAENLAVYIYGKVKDEMSKIVPNVLLKEIKVWESPDTSACFREEF